MARLGRVREGRIPTKESTLRRRRVFPRSRRGRDASSSPTGVAGPAIWSWSITATDLLPATCIWIPGTSSQETSCFEAPPSERLDEPEIPLLGLKPTFTSKPVRMAPPRNPYGYFGSEVSGWTREDWEKLSPRDLNRMLFDH